MLGKPSNSQSVGRNPPGSQKSVLGGLQKRGRPVQAVVAQGLLGHCPPNARPSGALPTFEHCKAFWAAPRLPRPMRWTAVLACLGSTCPRSSWCSCAGAQKEVGMQRVSHLGLHQALSCFLFSWPSSGGTEARGPQATPDPGATLSESAFSGCLSPCCPSPSPSVAAGRGQQEHGRKGDRRGWGGCSHFSGTGGGILRPWEMSENCSPADERCQVPTGFGTSESGPGLLAGRFVAWGRLSNVGGSGRRVLFFKKRKIIKSAVCSQSFCVCVQMHLLLPQMLSLADMPPWQPRPQAASPRLLESALTP